MNKLSAARWYFRTAKPRLSIIASLVSFSWLWFKESAIDIVTILVTTLLALVIYIAPPLASRSFAVTATDGAIVYPEFAYPLRKEIIPVELYIILGPALPIVILLALQLWVRSFRDANNAIFGVLYSLSTSILFQVVIKWLIGGLRPHFLDVCKPDLSRPMNSTKSPYNAAGFQAIYYTREICTGDPRKIDDSLTSFPSGHTTAAFAGFVFVYLYINGKFKVFANQHTPMWKLLLIHAPILVATLIGGALTIDEFHNWYDIVVGGIIGTVMAFSSYRMTYASIFDWRWNHIPLSRTVPFYYGLPLSNNSPDVRTLADNKPLKIRQQ